MSALVTRGYQSPSVASGGGAGGPSGVAIAFVLYDTDGELASGIDLSAGGVVQISKQGAAFTNRAGSAPTSLGDGTYYYVCDLTEIDVEWVLLKIEKAGYRTVVQLERITTPADTDSLATAIANAVAAIQSSIAGVALKTDNLPAAPASTGDVTAAQAALEAILDGMSPELNATELLSYEYAPGRTFVGLLRRWGASIERATGLKGTTVQFLDEDGNVIWSVSQSVTNGTRSNPNLGSTEDPP